MASALISAKAGLRRPEGCLVPRSGAISRSKEPSDHARPTTEATMMQSKR